ncbi:MAG: substrate-binding domain-containing protein [Brachybacterium sp.]|nr:substrate-binding domain-containing protein [Brachybacterium sp.]
MRTFGFPIRADIWTPLSEHYVTQILTGLESVAVRAGCTVLSQVVESREKTMELFRSWQRSNTVDAVVVRDLRAEDRWMDQLRSIGMPFVLLGDVAQDEPGIPIVMTDNTAACRKVVRELINLGHRRIAHVGGPEFLLHSRNRRTSYWEAVAEAGLPVITENGDYTATSGAQALDALRRRGAVPTVALFDNDAMALGAARRAGEQGLEIPGDISIVSWEDSIACQLHDPPLAALGHSVRQVGEDVGRALIALTADPSEVLQIRQAVPELICRRSLASPAEGLPPLNVKEDSTQ